MSNDLKNDILNILRAEFRNEIVTNIRNELRIEMRHELRNEIRNEIRNELKGIELFKPIVKFLYNDTLQYNNLHENEIAFNIFNAWYLAHMDNYESISDAFNKLIETHNFIEIHSNGLVETSKFVWAVEMT